MVSHLYEFFHVSSFYYFVQFFCHNLNILKVFCLCDFFYVSSNLGFAEFFFTVGTCIRILTCVTSFMFLQILILCKHFNTKRTSIMFFTSVSPFIDHHLWKMYCHNMNIIKDFFSCVGTFMAIQLTTFSKWFITKRTCIRFLICMSSCKKTYLRFFICMNSFTFLHNNLLCKCFITI